MWGAITVDVPKITWELLIADVSVHWGKEHFASKLGHTQSMASLRKKKKSQGTFNSRMQFCGEKKFFEVVAWVL